LIHPVGIIVTGVNAMVHDKGAVKSINIRYNK